MKTFIVLALVACACAAPGVVLYNSPLAVARTVIAAPIAVPAVTSSQYHAQDELGQYSYGYAGGPSAKAEAKTFDGVTRGGYSYIDANGLLQTVNYVADPVNGFRVAATNLPVAPAPVALAALPGPIPQQVADTPEVAAVKVEHARLHAQAAAAAAAAPDN
ncbi:unnamed protein product [Orchesella dallaii]|uniref:Cuticle protein 6 n=1 Tax=Orchesella dallaii TaxID=48710 RepID=A0ABP1QQ60_9HEXA